MKTQVTVLVVFGLAVMSSTSYADAGRFSPSQKVEQYNKEKKHKEKTDGKHNSLPKLSYLPPDLGAPSTSRLVGMALRSGGVDDFLLSVLTPAHTGLSLKAQPDIFWYTSKPVSKPFQFVEFVLISEKAHKPILRTHLASPKEAGIQKISLSKYGVSLEGDKEYIWSIALVPDPASRSHDFVTSGKIKYVKGNGLLFSTVKTSSDDSQPNIFAQKGYWYDAIASIITQTEQHPNDQGIRKKLTSLIEQVGLQQIAKKIEVSK
ncbi:MAG: DUF928 domain-containing protein [Methylococcaceae bacterium]|nr:DUF928 domain-containing protein [Methylococcaceae bacterium]